VLGTRKRQIEENARLLRFFRRNCFKTFNGVRLKTKTHTAPRTTNIMARDKYYYRVYIYLDGI